MSSIDIIGAREHNLKNIDISIPKNKMVVITGVSGSGKSTLAFDIIYSEGQRRYVESLSSYARQFIGKMTKPLVDSITGLSPAISIEQKSVNKNPRSTVGTLTEIYDYLRLLYANIGRAYCPSCGKEISKVTVDEIIRSIESTSVEGDRLLILSPVVRDKKGEHKNLFINLKKEGFLRVRVNGETLYLDEMIELNKNQKHTIEIVVDRMSVRKEDKAFSLRLFEAIEVAFKHSGGSVVIANSTGEKSYTENFMCADCNISFPEINARMFSFNAPYGACPECNGLGEELVIDPEKIILDPELSIVDGGLYIPGAATSKGYVWGNIETIAKSCEIDLTIPVKEVPREKLDLLIYGVHDKKFTFEYNGKNFNYKVSKNFEGIIPNLERRYKESASETMREEIEHKFMRPQKCPVCKGKKLKPEVLSIKINQMNIMDFCELSIEKSYNFIQGLTLTDKELQIADEVLKEVRSRLEFLINVGLDYLTLARQTRTLSGGESQRIRLATQIGIGLTGVIYVLDEPSIGLHQRDNQKLLSSLKKLRDLDNTLIIVEHDEETILEADYLIDIGPFAGTQGGSIVAQGSLEELLENPNSHSLTLDYLTGIKKIEVPKERRDFSKTVVLKGARGNNLTGIDIEIPLGVLTAVTGVSGSGKSTLINQTLYPILFNRLNKGKLYPLDFDAIEGLENLNKVIGIDQSPIGRTPRSNPATYTKVFDTIRDIFAECDSSKLRGYDKGRFSFNVKGGRCEACQGAGIIKIEMNFLPDVYIECEVCKGKKYNREILEVQYKGKNISEVLEMTVLEAYEFFKNVPAIEKKLKVLIAVGLEYIHLGQAATTLSGGEAQRIKLAAELSKTYLSNNIYILDEPTTGLHFHDIAKLMTVLNELVERGNSVVVIEHNLDVIKTADYIIDMGPDGGERGGKLLFSGRPEEIVKCKKSYTGQYLKKYFK